MTCRICGNSEGNTSIIVREMQHCSRERFPYFRCGSCGCLQIEHLPHNIGDYYPQDYYSFNQQDADAFMQEEMSSFKKLQAEYIIHGRRKVLGKLATRGYRHPLLFDW